MIGAEVVAVAMPAVAKLMKLARFGATLPSAEPSVTVPVPAVVVDMPARSKTVAMTVTGDRGRGNCE